MIIRIKLMADYLLIVDKKLVKGDSSRRGWPKVRSSRLLSQWNNLPPETTLGDASAISASLAVLWAVLERPQETEIAKEAQRS